MNKSFGAFVLVTFVTAFYASGFAETEYVIANVNRHDPGKNALVVYRLDTATGTLTQTALLVTGGEGYGDDGLIDLVNVEEAISGNADCIFALDGNVTPQPSDIAAF